MRTICSQNVNLSETMRQRNFNFCIIILQLIYKTSIADSIELNFYIMDDNKSKETDVELQDIYKSQDHYSDSGFWDTAKKVAKKVGKTVLNPALTLYYTLQKDDLDLSKKAAIIGALGYLILPIDLIPDFTPIFGYTDDLAALVAVLKMVKDEINDNITAQVVKKLKEMLG